MAKSASRSSKPRDEKRGIDRAFDRFLRFGNDQIPGAKPQRNVVEELLGNLGRGRAGIRGDLVPPSTDFRREPQQRGATLREGMSGPQVKALQDDLVRAGLLKPGEATGKFAGATAAAVRQLEQMHGLNRDAGVAGRQVLGQLRGNAMPPPVPTSRQSTAAPTTRTAGTAPITPVERRDMPPPVTATPATIPPPSPTPSPTNPPPVPQPTAQPDPLKAALDAAAAARAAADAQRAAPPPPQAGPAPAPQVSPEWQAYIDSQKDAKLRAGEDRGMEGWPPPAAAGVSLMGGPGAGTRTSPTIGPMGERDPQVLTSAPPGPPADMALRRAEDQFGGSRFVAPPATPTLQSRQDDARVAADKALRDAQTAPQVAPPPSAATAPPAMPPPAGLTPIVDRSVFGPGYNADPLGGKEQGRLGSSYGPRGGPLSSAELPPGYQPPLPPRADIAFNAPSLSPAAPKGGPGGVMSPAALASLPGSGMLASQEARPSLRQAGAMPGAPPPIPQVQTPPAPRANDLQILLNLPGGPPAINPGAIPGGRQGGGSLTMADRGAGSTPQPGPLGGYNVMPGQRLSDVPFLSPSIPTTQPPPPPSPTPQATAPPPGGASGYGRNLADVRNAIEIPTFGAQQGAQQGTPQFPATGWASAPGAPHSSPPPPRDQEALLQGLLSMGVDAPNLSGVLSNMPGSVSFNPAEAQADAERQKNELYQQMDREDALKQGGGQSSYYRDLGGGAFSGGASDNILAGGIPTIQAPSLENIVQPQIDQGGQGLLGGTPGMFDQVQDVGPAGGQSDSGVLDAVSQIADSIGSNQQDQQSGGDQGATASAASGDNPFTAAQTAEQQGILAMLEEMFGSGSTR